MGMKGGTMNTYNAAQERATKQEMENQIQLLNKNDFLREIINIATEIALIINKYRQIIFANDVLLDVFGKDDESNIVGYRPGEIFNCIHASETKDGCGTSRSCKYCGAFNAILQSRSTKEKVTSELRLTVGEKNDFKNLDLRVTAISIEFEDQIFTLLSIADISDKKRRDALEKIFYHDVVNKIGGINSLVELAKCGTEGKNIVEIPIDVFEMIQENAKELLDEILAQRDLNLAENNKLEIKPVLINSLELLKSKIKLFKEHDIAIGKEVRIKEGSEEIIFESDKVILGRVMENLIKNSLEASLRGMEVVLGCLERDDLIEFTVYNATEMSEEAKFQLFHRSFSTKGENRGLGTYSIKLFTDQYLNGEVEFISEKGKGTTFYLKIPKMIEPTVSV